jgi:hypothetical protein
MRLPCPSSPSSPSSPSEEATLLERIDAILDRHLSEAQQDLELVQLAKQLDNYNASEIRALAAKRRRERDEEDNLSERKQELERLESWDCSPPSPP